MLTRRPPNRFPGITAIISAESMLNNSMRQPTRPGFHVRFQGPPVEREPLRYLLESAIQWHDARALSMNRNLGDYVFPGEIRKSIDPCHCFFGETRQAMSVLSRAANSAPLEKAPTSIRNDIRHCARQVWTGSVEAFEP